MRATSLTAVELSARSGVSRPTISEILNQRTDAEDDTLERLSKALDWPIPELTVHPPTRVSTKKTSRTTIGSKRTTGPPGTGEDLTGREEDVVNLVGGAITAAVQQAIERDELEHTETHRRLLGELLTDLGVLLEKNGIRATELLQVAMRLRKEGKGGG